MMKSRPSGFENMSPVRGALEVALHELVMVNGLRVTDIPDAEATWVIDTRESIGLLTKTLNELEHAEGHSQRD